MPDAPSNIPATASAATGPLRLNLGSGQRSMPGYINVDKFGSPDVKWDLEQFPWPWPDNSVSEIALHHVLEHLGASIDTFFSIIKELYRISRDGAIIHIVVPHPRHDDFLSDPTHVRAFAPETFHQYSKARCLNWKLQGAANTPLALYLGVDFTTDSVDLDLDEPWKTQLRTGQITEEQAQQAGKQFCNVIKQIRVRWVAHKPAAK